MKKTAYLSVALGLLVAGPVYAQSPLPTFDKEAVTEYPYNRRGEQQVITKDPTLDEVKVGNAEPKRKRVLIGRESECVDPKPQ